METKKIDWENIEVDKGPNGIWFQDSKTYECHFIGKSEIIRKILGKEF